jgi:hypothetical protein
MSAGRAGWVPVLILALALMPGAAFAQQMPAKTDTMMMHGKTLEGVVSRIRFLSCGETAQSCQGILEITPTAGESGEMMPPAGSTITPSAGAGRMMMPHPVTVIVIPGAALMWQHAPVPLTRLHAGDVVTLTYNEVGNMNVVTELTMTAMGGHM